MRGARAARAGARPRHRARCCTRCPRTTATAATTTSTSCASAVLPAIRPRELASAVDVFCDDVAFTRRRVPARAARARRRSGSRSRVHADQLSRSGGAALAAELGRADRPIISRARPTRTGGRSRRRAPWACCCRRAALTLGQTLPEAEMLRASGRPRRDRHRLQPRHGAGPVAARVRGARGAAVRVHGRGDAARDHVERGARRSASRARSGT